VRNVLRLVYSWMLSLNLANNPTNEQRANSGGLECVSMCWLILLREEVGMLRAYLHQ
jgi:hypothetical protein